MVFCLINFFIILSFLLSYLSYSRKNLCGWGWMILQLFLYGWSQVTKLKFYYNCSMQVKCNYMVGGRKKSP